MRQTVRWGPSRRIWAVAAGMVVAAGGLAGPGSDAHAQRFNDVIQNALDNNCEGIKGPFQSSLNSVCFPSGPPGPGGPGASSGASIAAQTVRQQGADERRIQLRLEEQRQARGEGGVRAASSDTGFQRGKLGLFVTGEGDWIEKNVTRFEPGFSSTAGGVMVGADYRVLPWLTAGLAFSYLNTQGDFH